MTVRSTSLIGRASTPRSCRFCALEKTKGLQLLRTASCPTTCICSWRHARRQFSAFYYARQFGERLWQRYGFERTLREEDATLPVARYILENPVRAKLVQNPEEYPFSGSTTHTLSDVLTAIGDFKGPAKAGHYI